MRIAIVGSGISGMVAAHHLCRNHDITVFEANDYIGGHTNTISVEAENRPYAVDTGFIVFNDRTYPEFSKLIAALGVPVRNSVMTFGVKCDRTGLEYAGTSLDTLFAQRLNLLRPRFYRMIADILRFNREAPELVRDARASMTLGDYLHRHEYSRSFIEHYIIPMGAAIWSAEPVVMKDFPARYFVEFFSNHGLLSLKDRPQWKVIAGGSHRYVQALTAPYADRIRLSAPVQRIVRRTDQIFVHLADGTKERFDRVFLACHSDQALNLVDAPTRAERDVLSAIPYQENEAVLHTDTSILPSRKKTWAAWNYHVPARPQHRVAVTYNMNALQGLDAKTTFLVTLNSAESIDAEKIIHRVTYNHPVFNQEGIRAQRRHREINGAGGIYYCGAYWGFGFHEDGVRSGLAAVEAFEEDSRHEKRYLQRTG